MSAQAVRAVATDPSDAPPTPAGVGAPLLWAAVIGAARVMVGVHYLSDVWGAMVVGAVAATTVFLTRPLFRPILSFTLSVARRLRLA